MGRGQITDSKGDGEYDLDLDYGSEAIAATIATLNTLITRLTDEQTELQDKIDAYQADFATADANLNSAIDAYKQALQSGGDVDKKPLTDATSEALAAKTSLQKAQTDLNINVLALSEAQSKIDYLQSLDVTSSITTWCVDYTPSAEDGEVATIEVPGEPDSVLIAPGALAPEDSDGIVRARAVQTGAQLYYNLALLPGWQKHLPTFRFGTISNIDTVLDTCDVALDDALSSAQNLNVNQSASLSEVPIDYMTCDAAAFEDDDRVVVQFDGQNWDEPKVIGFVDHPRPCDPAQITFRLDAGAPAVVDTYSWANRGCTQLSDDGTDKHSSFTPPYRKTWTLIVHPHDWVFIDGATGSQFCATPGLTDGDAPGHGEDIEQDSAIIRFDAAYTAKDLNPEDKDVWWSGFVEFEDRFEVVGLGKQVILPGTGPLTTGINLLSPGFISGYSLQPPPQMENIYAEWTDIDGNITDQGFLAVGQRSFKQTTYFWGGNGDDTPVSVDEEWLDFHHETMMQFYSPPETIMVKMPPLEIGGESTREVSYTLRVLGPPPFVFATPPFHPDEWSWKDYAAVTYIRTDLLDQL